MSDEKNYGQPTKTQEELMDEQGYLSAGVAGEKAGVPIQTVHRWIRLGKLEAVKATDRWYVSKASLAEHLGPILGRAAGLIVDEEDPFEGLADADVPK